MNARLFSLLKKFLIFIVLSGLFLSSCKRIVKSELAEDAPPVQTSFKVGYEKIAKLKLPLKTVMVDKMYSLNIPEGSSFEVNKYGVEDEFTGTIVNIDLSKIKNAYYNIALNNVFTRKEKLYSEDVFIIPIDDPKFTTITSIKDDGERIDEIYFEDENSIMYEQSDSFYAYTIHYDDAKKVNIIYKAEMSWSKKFPKKEKIDLFMHFVRHGKSLLLPSYPAVKLSSWADYVENMPVLEINWAGMIFNKLEKELKYFLPVNESVSPRTEGNYTFVELYHTSQEQALNFYQSIDVIKANKVSELEYSSNRGILYLNSQHKYNLKEDSGSYLVNETFTNSDGDLRSINFTVFYPIDYKNKSYLLKSDTEIGEADYDFFVKMFSYFGKNLTLKTKLNAQS